MLVSHDEIMAGNEDDYGYAYEASVWHWGVGYQTYAYSRQPVYAIFLAMADVFGCPARLWIELAWAGAASVMLVLAPAAGDERDRACLAAFGLVLLHPWTLALFNRFLCDSLYGALFLAFLCALAVGVTRVTTPSMLRWGALVAAAGALAANTRLESVLLLGSLGVAGACAFGLARWSGADRRLTVRRLACLVLVPLLAIFGLTHAIRAATWWRVGSYVTSDLEMPGFKKLYAELLTIRPAHPDLLLSAPRDAREWAYAHSPTFALLRPPLESDPDLAVFQKRPRQETGAEGECGAWTVWALRAAAWKVRSWPNARELDNFYAKAADEIHAALRADPAMARWVPITFIPPEWGQIPPALCGSLARCWEAMLRPKPLRVPDVKIDAEGRARFDSIGNRRVPLIQLRNGQTVSGSLWYAPANVRRLDRCKNAICGLLKPIVIGSMLLTAIGLIAGLIGIRRRLFPARWWILSVLLITAILARIMVVALLDMTGIRAQMRYLFPVTAPTAHPRCAERGLAARAGGQTREVPVRTHSGRRLACQLFRAAEWLGAVAAPDARAPPRL